MALTLSTDKTDKDNRELLEYGTPDFPAAFFDDDLTIVRVPWHWHDELEIVLITEGTVHARIAGHTFEMKAGEGYLVGSGILHEADLVTSTGHQHAIVFSDRLVGGPTDIFWRSCAAPLLKFQAFSYLHLHSDIDWHKKMLDMAEEAWQAGAFEKTDHPFTVRDRLSRVLMEASRHLSDQPKQLTARYAREEERVKLCLGLIEKSYSQPLSVERIAAAAGISVSECLRCFHDIMGTTPVKYLNDYRLDLAAELLSSDSSVPVSFAATSCGFDDMSYFSRVFKKRFGTSPRDYRK